MTRVGSQRQEKKKNIYLYIGHAELLCERSDSTSITGAGKGSELSSFKSGCVILLFYLFTQCPVAYFHDMV